MNDFECSTSQFVVHSQWVLIALLQSMEVLVSSAGIVALSSPSFRDVWRANEGGWNSGSGSEYTEGGSEVEAHVHR